MYHEKDICLHDLYSQETANCGMFGHGANLAPPVTPGPGGMGFKENVMSHVHDGDRGCRIL